MSVARVLGAMESREPRTIRYAPAEWAVFVEAAHLRGVEPSALARECSLIGVNVICTRALLEAYVRITSSLRPEPGPTPALNGAKR